MFCFFNQRLLKLGRYRVFSHFLTFVLCCIVAHVTWRWAARSDLSFRALWGSVQKLHSFLCGRTASHRKLQTVENNRQREFCKSEIGKTHPHRQRGNQKLCLISINDTCSVPCERKRKRMYTFRLLSKLIKPFFFKNKKFSNPLGVV